MRKFLLLVLLALATPALAQNTAIRDPVTLNTACVNTSSGLCVAGTPTTQTNSATTVTTGGTFQTGAAASTTRKAFEFQNICNKSGNCTATTNNCYVFVAASGTPTTANSIIVQAGWGYLRSIGAVPSDAIQVTCDGTGDKFYLAVQ